MQDILKEITAALLIIFNVGIVTRTVQELLAAKEDENGPSPGKIITKNIKVAIVINLVGALVLIIKRYYGY